MQKKPTGILYIVATPIGNLADITLRALEILKSVDLIAAEDTRHSKILLQHYAISTKMIALHDYNESDKSLKLLEFLLNGKNIALISDAGTPLISDPGYHLINTIKPHAAVMPIPGPCALIAALSASGLPTNQFIFAGFPPIKTHEREGFLQSFINETRTVVLYEAPHRILDLITAMQKNLGENRFIVLAKELTKTFETISCGTINAIQKWLTENIKKQKGEFVVLIKGVEEPIAISDVEIYRILKILLTKLSTKDASALAAKITGKSKHEIYQKAVNLPKI